MKTIRLTLKERWHMHRVDRMSNKLKYMVMCHAISQVQFNREKYFNIKKDPVVKLIKDYRKFILED